MHKNDFIKTYGVKFTENHTGKMDGMASLSTSCAMNAICRKRAADPESICSKCYAQSMLKRYNALDKMLVKNTEVLTKQIIPADAWPVLNYSVFRLESFGDLANKTQVINYFNLCKRNKRTTFALWTKNPQFIKQAIAAGHKKPNNLIVIFSSPYINTETSAETIRRYWPFVDKVFTVYDSPYIKAHNVTINCGARNCLECSRCYTKKKSLEYVNEKLK